MRSARRVTLSCLFCLAGLLYSLSGIASADDWPQWMGPQRDNVWRETGIVTRFPDNGPPILWRSKLAGGYSGPAVADGRVYITDYVTADNVQIPNFERKESTGIERVLCLNEADGELLWRHEYPVKYTVSYPSGPRCTPNVYKGKVYTLGAEGHLFCFDAETGKVIWSKVLTEEYNAKTPLWGYAAHPLIDGRKLITLAGGSGSHVVALDLETGDEIWRALTSPEQGYAPPTIIQSGGVRQLILLRPDAVTSVDPETGREYWSVPYEASNGSIIMSPVFNGELLYVGGFSNKNLLLRLDKTKPAASEVWRDRLKQAMAPINVQPFLSGEVLYGFDQAGPLYAMDLKTGERIWSSNEVLRTQRPLRTGTAMIVKQGDRGPYWLFTEKGELVIADLTPNGYRELDQALVIQPSNVAFGRDVVWSQPAFANRHAYIRNDKEIISVDLAVP